MPGDDRTHRLVGGTLGVLVFALGALVVAGRHLGLPILYQFDPDWLPTQYNPGLCLIGLGLALVALAAGRLKIAAVLGLVPTLVGAITLVTWIFGLSPGIDELFMRNTEAVLNPNPGRMSPMAALAFLLSGASVGLAVNTSRVPAFAVVAWVIGVLACVGGGLATLANLLVDSRTAIESLRFTYVSTHSGLGIALSGGAIVALTRLQRRSASPEDRGWQLPVMAGVSCAMFSVALWQGFAVAEAEWLAEDTRLQGQRIVAQLDSDRRARAGFFAQLAEYTGEQVGGAAEQSWVAYATSLIRGADWLHRLAWLDLDGTVRHQVSNGKPAGVLAETKLPIADATGRPVGQLYVATDLEALLPTLINQPEHSYNLRLSADSATVYTWPEGAAPDDRRAARVFQTEVSVAGRLLRLSLWPGEQVLTRRQALLPRITLLFGLALSLLLTIALRYEAVSRQRAASISRARQLIEHEVEERRRAEESARGSESRARQALAELRQILDQSLDLICTMDHRGHFGIVSASAEQILGYRPEEMSGRFCDDFIAHEDRARSRENAAAVVAGARGEFRNRLIHKSGRLVDMSWQSVWLAETQTGYLVGRDITAQKRQEVIREGQRQVLELIAGGAPQQVALDGICRFVEAINPAFRCTLMVMDADGKRLRSAAGPSMPADFLAEVDNLEVGPAAGCCGTAVWRKQLVVTTDIDADPRWDRHRPVAARHGLKSCWSTPVMGEQGAVLGAFALYSRERALPEPYELEMIDAAAGLAAVAIERAEAHRSLLAGREQLEFARRIARLGYWEADLVSGRIVLSDDVLDTLGLPRGQAQNFNDLLGFVVEEDRSALSTSRQAALRHDVPIDTEIRLRLPGGALCYCHFLGRTIRRDDGDVIKLAGTVQDVTARKQIELENARLYAELEDRVRNRTRELEQSNRELEAFSYSVSHDLRAPLRAISGFGALLQQESAASMGQQGQHYLERIVSGAVRMSTLIDDLLELGRASRIELHRQPLDLSALASSVSGRLHERWPDRVVDLEVQPDLVAWGDLKLMEIVMENLLENAWKFTGSRPVGRIRVGSMQQQGERAFFVTDNGVGFDPRYAANLFGVFQRLHAATAFPGTGVGLATVQRILQRHGGRIWADARADEGATFYFTMA